MPLNGFEVRGAHRDSTAPTTNDCSNKVYGLQLAAGAPPVSGVYKLIGLKLISALLAPHTLTHVELSEERQHYSYLTGKLP